MVALAELECQSLAQTPLENYKEEPGYNLKLQTFLLHECEGR